MQLNKTITVLSKGLRWVFGFTLMLIVLFGVALGVSMTWPTSVVGWVLAGIPFILWNCRKILFFCKQIGQQIGYFSYKLLHSVFILIHKRKWTAIFCWGVFFLYKPLFTFLVSIFFFLLYIFIFFREAKREHERWIKYMRERGLPVSKFEALLYIYDEQRKFRKLFEDWLKKNRRGD